MPARVNDPAADDRQLGNGIGNVALRAREIVAIRNNQVGELARLDPTLLAFFVGEPGDVLGPKTQRRLAVEAVALRIDAQAPDRAPCDEPGERYPRIVGGDTRRIGAGGDLDAFLQHARERRRGFGRTRTIAFNEVFALIGHAVLYGDAAAQRRDPVDRLLRDRLGVIEEPMQTRRAACPGSRARTRRARG